MTMGEVIGQRYPFAVPRYQRAYAWDDEAVGYFVRDVEAMLQHPAGQTSHFFGGVVCIQFTDHQNVHPTSYEIVDGQQRMATLMLALSCVVEMASDLERRSRKSNPAVANRAKTLIDDLRENSLTWKHSDVAAGTSMTRRRMELSLVDDPVFEKLVQGGSPVASTRESHDLLIAARAALMEMTRKYVGGSGALAKRIDKLIRLRQALLQEAHVVHIVSQERSQAYRLFSVLNHRGESLSDADLLRSRTLELLEAYPTEQESAAQIWDEMLGHPAAQIEAFFRALYPSTCGRRAQGDLFEAIQKAFLPDESPSTQAQASSLVDVVNWFRDELGTYLQIIRGDWPYDRSPGAASVVRAWQVDRLRRLVVTLRHDLAVPVLLAAARSLDEATFAELVYMLEVFAFRYKIICNGHATRPGNIYYEQARLMREATASSPYVLQPFRKELRDLVADKAGDALFRQLLSETLRYSNASQRVNIKEFLTVLEDHRSWWLKTGLKYTNARPRPPMTKVIDIESATLEHIYPQNADPADKEPAWEPLKHTLGNLTFFGSADNVAAGNKSFAAKRVPNYQPSEIGMTFDLAKKASWGRQDAIDRETELLQQAVRIFIL